MEKSSIKNAAAFFVSMLFFILACTVISANPAFAAVNNINAETKPYVTIDGKDVEILKAGQSSQITMGVYLDGQPLSGQVVSLDGYGQWTTGQNGTFTANITPRNGDDIGIHVGDQYYYRGFLFAVEDNQSVVEVRLQDSTGVDLDNFCAWARNDDMHDDIDCEGSVARVLVRQGLNKFIVERRADGDDSSYFVMKDAEVPEGIQLYQVDITNADYMSANLNFSYDGSPMYNGNVILGKNIEGSWWRDERGIGNINGSGVRNINITPGNYKVDISGSIDGNEIYFMNYVDILPGTNIYNFGWDPGNTGIVTVDVANTKADEISKALFLNGSWIKFDNPDGVRINSGTYKLDSINVNYNIDGNWKWYNYRMPQGEEETITVSNSAPVDRTYDLTSLDLTLGFYNSDLEDSDIQLDNPVHFGVMAPTPSGYLLQDKEENRDWDFNIVKPNGEKNYWRGYFKDQWWYLGADNPAGQYTINAGGALYPLYGYTNLSASFIAKKPTITIDGSAYKIIRAGEDSTVTIAVTLDGEPISNQKVSLDGYGEWMTGPDGTVAVDLHSLAVAI